LEKLKAVFGTPARLTPPLEVKLTMLGLPEVLPETPVPVGILVVMLIKPVEKVNI